MKKSVKIICLIMCILCLATAFVSCGTRTMLTYEDKTLSINVYEFLLSRMKGTLGYYGYQVEKDSFWNKVNDLDTGMTYNDYFCETIKIQAMNYIVADKMFDEAGLQISDSDEAKVDELMNAYVKRAGSKTALNEELKEFGVNYDILREIYILEAKIELLKDHIYGKNGEKLEKADKDEYFNENYVAFRQIFLATYEYLIDEDEFGDTVYYTDEKHTAIAYDKVNGKTKNDEFGKPIEDIFDAPVYYTADGKIAYDTKNGVMGYVTNESGDKVIKELDDTDKAELNEKAKEYAEKCNKNSSLFEEYASLYDESENQGVIYLFSSDGYYAAQNSAVAYFDEMAEKLEGMDVGECLLYKSDYGYHVLCRYENEPEAYGKKENEDVFKSFSEDLISRLFEKLCQSKFDGVEIDGEVFASAPTMKEAGVNTLY